MTVHIRWLESGKRQYGRLGPEYRKVVAGEKCWWPEDQLALRYTQDKDYEYLDDEPDPQIEIDKVEAETKQTAALVMPEKEPEKPTKKIKRRRRLFKRDEKEE